MTREDSLLFSKIIITFSFFFITGLPFIWMHKTSLPKNNYIIAGVLVSFSLILHWREFFNFKKGIYSWIIALLLILTALFRRNVIPPFSFKIYDVFFLFIAFLLIYQSSNLKKLLLFSSVLISPLSLMELYGFMPSSYVTGILLGAGLIGALLLPKSIPLLHPIKKAQPQSLCGSKEWGDR